MNGQYRWEANIKLNRSFNGHNIERIMDGIFDQYDRMKPKGASKVRINVDVDAVE